MSPPGLIQQDAIEVVPDAIKLLQAAYSEVKQLISSIEDSESAMNDVLLKHSLTSQNACNAVQLGLLYSCLCEPQFAPKAFKFLLLTTKDNLNLAVTEISRLLGEYWAKLLDTPRQQLLWLFNELVKSNTANAEHVLHHLLRRMTGGDLTPLNLWLVDNVLTILGQHRHTWLDKKAVVPVVVYAYLRLLADHAAAPAASALERLRRREVDFVLPLLRDNFTDCLAIGRDLLRLLQELARLPEFERLWSDVLHSPASLSPKFAGVAQLLAQPPSPVCITSRLTHDMEQRIKWYLKFVHMGSHKRYLDWLTRKYLSTPESQSLRVDWIRFVVTQVHPSNETIASEVVQRWAFISWLLLSCTSPTVVCNMKLALYYDWLMFEPAQHNLMNIEPGVLVIQNNLARPQQQHLALSMLDFLCRLADNYYPALAPEIRRRLRFCLVASAERKVVHSLGHVLDPTKMDRQVHGLLRHTFQDLVPAQPQAPPTPTPTTSAAPRTPDPASLALGGLQPTPIYDSAIIVSAAAAAASSGGGSSGRVQSPTTVIAPSTPANHEASAAAAAAGLRSATPPPPVPTSPAPPTNHEQPQPQQQLQPPPPEPPTSATGRRRSESAEFSDAEMSDAENGGGGGGGGGGGVSGGGTSGCGFVELRRDFQRLRLRYQYQVERVDIEPYLQQLDPVMRDRLVQLRDERDAEAQCEIMYQVVQGIIEEEDIDLDFSRRIATCLCEICHAQLEGPIFPADTDATSLEDSVSAPIFVIFRTLCQYSEDDPKRQPLYLLLSEMASRHPRVGYYLLYFLKVDRAQSQDDKFVAYKEFCKSQENPDLRACLFKDLGLLAQDDPRLLAYLLPEVFRNFSGQCQNNAHLMRTIVSSVDCSQLQTMVADIMQGHLELFRKDSLLVSLLRDSLSWESVEQLFLWQLLNAQDLPTERFLPLLPHLDSGRHPEATTNLLLMLKLEQPSSELVSAVLWREPALADPLCPSILHFWSEQKLNRLAELLSHCLVSPGPSGASASSGRGAAGQQQQHQQQQQQQRTPPPLEQTLRHLDVMRQRLRNLSLLQHELIQDALREVVRSAPAELRYAFPDLLALAADDLDDDQAGGGQSRTRSLRAVPSRKAAAAARSHPTGGGGGSGHSGSSQKRSAARAAAAAVSAIGGGSGGGQQGDNSTSSSSSSEAEDDAGGGGGSGGPGIANRRRHQRPKKRMRQAAGSSGANSDSGLSNSDIFTTDYH